MTFYRSGRGEGSFERGIEMALRGVLANPKFILRAELRPLLQGPFRPRTRVAPVLLSLEQPSRTMS